MSLLAFLLCVVLLMMVLNLRGRVKELEHILKSRPITPVPATAATGAPGAGTVAVAATSAPLSSPPATSLPPQQNLFLAWISENWLLKLGALLLLIGFGWLVTYAFLNNWIGPMGRIAFGLVAGAGILALGYWRMRTFVTQGAVFVALGAAVILLTTYAAR